MSDDTMSAYYSDVTALDSTEPTQVEAIAAAWEHGDIGDMQAARELCMELGEIASEREPLDQQEKTIRDLLGRIVARMPGQKAEVKGFGALAITPASESTSWDTKSLDAYIAELLQDGDAGTAARIAACRKTSQRSASLRITREKTK